MNYSSTTSNSKVNYKEDSAKISNLLSKSKTIFGVKTNEPHSNTKIKIQYNNSDIINPYSKLGVINKLNTQNLKRKRNRLFSNTSIGSMDVDLNWVNKDDKEKDDILIK